MRSLTEKQISEIRELYKSGLYNKKELANMYNVSQPTIALWLPETSSFRDWKIHLRRERITICSKCGVSIKVHPRCSTCTILLHKIECDCD